MLENKYFKLPSKEDSEALKNNASELFISKYLNKHYSIIKNLSEDLLRMPSPEEIFFLQTDNAFNAFTFIPLIAKAQTIKELFATTYSINIRVIESLVELHDAGLVEQITLMISDGLVTRNPTTYNLLNSILSTRPNIKVLYSWNHSKIMSDSEKHRDGGISIKSNDFQPNFPEKRKDYSESTGHVKEKVFSVIGILLMFSSIFIGAYGESVIWDPIVYVPISFSVFLLSIYILSKCQT